MGRTMKAIVVMAPQDVRIVHDVPVPRPGEYEALVCTRACGFCNGTDFQIINGTLTKEEGMSDFPTILGHEAAGEVVELGSKVRHIKEGDRFIRPNLKADPGGGYTRTYGNMAEYGLVADWQAMLEDGFSPEELPYRDSMGAIPRTFDFNDGGVLLSLLECHSAVENFGIRENADVLVYGAGPMGLGMLCFIKQKNPAYLAVVDGLEDRLAGAQKCSGVDAAINFSSQDVDEALRGRQFDYVLDCVGSTKIIKEASARLKPGGKVCSMGVLKSDDFNMDLSKLRNNTSLHMLNFPYRRFGSLDAVIKMIEEGIINPKDFYSHVLPAEEIHKAMEMVRSKQALKVVLSF